MFLCSYYCWNEQKEIFLRQRKSIHLFILTCTIRSLFLVLMLSFLSACVTVRDCSIETLSPAGLALPVQKGNIAICASPKLLLKAAMSNEGTFGISTDSLIMNILYSLQGFWAEAPDFGNTKFSIFEVEATSFTDFDKYDLIVRLDKLEVSNAYYGEQYNYQDWEAHLHVHYVADWSVRNQSGQLLDNYIDRDLMIWSSGIRSGRTDAVLNLPSVNNAWWDMGIAIAKNYAERIVPQWKKEVRTIYMVNKFSDLSQQAYTAMQNNGYARAFDIWETMLMSCRKSGQHKIKGQITYNMAVACEFQNRLDDAVQWIQQSANYSQKKTTLNYLKLLKERQQQKILLDQQINH